MKNNNKSSLNSIISVMGILIIMASCLLTGCAGKGINTNEGNSSENSISTIKERNQNEIIDEFRILLKNNPKPDAVIKFIDRNIPYVQNANASLLVDGLEEVQLKYLPQLVKLYSGDSIQKKLSNALKPGVDINKIGNVEDSELCTLLTDTKIMGYKVEIAEGMYYPIINYETYKKYSPYVTEDMKAYIDLMVVESNKAPSKDAALMIGWDEIIKRAQAQENFIKTYVYSTKAEAVKKLQKKYMTFMLYGTNNTPLFDYETKIIVPEAKNIYLNAAKDTADSNLRTILEKFMDKLKKTNYKLSDTAEKYRKEILESL